MPRDLTPLDLDDAALDRAAEITPESFAEGGQDRENAEEWARANLSGRANDLLDAEVD